MAKPKSADLSRAERKAKKRALEDAIPDLPGDNEPEVEDSTESSEKKSKKRKREQDGEDSATVIENGEEKEKKKAKKEKKDKKDKAKTEAMEDVGEEGAKAEKKSKKEKKEKKSKSEPTKDAELATSEVADVGMGEGSTDAAVPKKSKKERKAERRAAELAAKATEAFKLAESEKSADAAVKINGNSKATEEKKASEEGDKKSKKNNRNREKKRKGETTTTDGEGAESKAAPRFIVFVGNLPYTANKISLEKHFASVQPKSIRVLTEKSQPTKCRGAAFVEFEGYDHMKTCLKLFHHSNFDDGASAPRKINVELTAGGGGNTSSRKAKIEAKNTKLNEERIRRMQEDEKAKATKALGGGNKAAAALDESAIHPSRRRFVPGA